MDDDALEELQTRVRRLEDEAAITRLIMSYGPAADVGLTSFAGQLWLEDGVYDWDAEGEPHLGSAELTRCSKARITKGSSRVASRISPARP